MDARPATDERKLVAFVLPDLRGGGVERITIELMGEFLRRGYRVDLVLARKDGEFLGLVPQGVRLFVLGTSRLRQMLVPLRRYIETERPDAIRASMWPLTVMAIIAAKSTMPRPRIVVSEHTLLTKKYRSGSAMRLKLLATIFATYRFADGIAAVSTEVAADVARLAAVPGKRVATIHNPVPAPLRSDQDPDALWGDATGSRILALGHLKKVKNFPFLIEAFKRLAERQDATLAIVGEGEERAALESIISGHGLERRVLLPGFSATPGDWLAGADLFVLSSEFEGFGNVLVEALHHGLPIVSTDCPGGPAEILGRGRWGRLVPPNEVVTLAEAMSAALAEHVDREELRRRARDFSIESAADCYCTLLFGRADPHVGD